MDGKPEIDLDPAEESVFLDTCLLYRKVHENCFNRVSPRKPTANMFNPEDDGVSVDWNKYSTPEESLIRTGLTYKPNTTNFKDHTKFHVVQLKVGDIRTIEEIAGIAHTPILNDPEPVGSPNNMSHSSVFYSDVEIRLKLVACCNEVEGIKREEISEKVNALIAVQRST